MFFDRYRRFGRIRPPRRLERHFSQPKIEHFYLATVADKDIRRFNIAMHNALRMRRIQRIRNLNAQFQNDLDF